MNFEASCPARAALAGNPSDGYGGFVVAVPVTSVAASVTVTPGDRFEIVHSPTDDDTFDTLDSLVHHLDRFGMDDSRRLVLATIRALVRHHAARVDPCRIEVTTTIPRSVGLAGSSAIVIATIRALVAAHSASQWACDLASEPDLVAALALSVESSELGIAAGLQDRLVQSHGCTLAMDFSEMHRVGPFEVGLVEPLPNVPGRLVVASRPANAQPSGQIHRSLRDDHDADLGSTRSMMSDIADQGRRAAEAVRAADVSILGAAIDRTLTLRAELLPLDPAMLDAAAAVRLAGGHANWSGSGGSITVLLPNGVDESTLIRTLENDHECTLLDP